MRKLLSLVALAAAVVTVAGIALASRDGGRAAPVAAPAAEHPVTAPEEPRTVTLTSSMPLPSASERNLSAMVLEGPMPDSPTTAEVLTDTDCTPDAAMISRCRNEVLLPDGRVLALRHPHDMRKIPCLTPGERVRLVPASPS